MDVNDNAPVFPEGHISHEISELAEPGTALAVPAATDPDSGRNAIYRYDVIPRDGKFELTTRATADGGTDLRLVLRERLDRELEDSYTVTVLAVDGGESAKTGSVVVNVTVLDANDNSPQFDNSSYEVATRSLVTFIRLFVCLFIVSQLNKVSKSIRTYKNANMLTHLLIYLTTKTISVLNLRYLLFI